MSSLLFWMIFIQVSIFFIGAFLVISWLVLEPKQNAMIRTGNGRTRYRYRRARMQGRTLETAEI